MGNAYGTIIVSGDYEGNAEAIANALNSLNLHNDDVKFSAYGNHVTLDGYGVQRPTVFPKREILVLDDGRRHFADEADESIVKEWEAGKCLNDNEEYSLEQLSSLIAPLLTQGTIELVAVAYEKNKYAYYDRLVITCDGFVERYYNYAEADYPSEFCEDPIKPEYYYSRTKKCAA